MPENMERLVELVVHYQQAHGDESALALAEEFICTIGPMLKAFVYRHCPPSEAEDISQEVFVAIVRNLHMVTARETRVLLGWCYGVARHIIANKYRKRMDKATFTVSPEELEKAVEASAIEEPFQPEEQHELQLCLARLRRVKPPCYDYLTKHYFRGLDLGTLAREYGLTYNAMRMRINRCLELAKSLAVE